ncbi:MAG: SCO family protein [Pseudomonadota bacterium]
MMKYLTVAASLALLAACGGADAPQTAGGDQANCSTRAYDEIGGPVSLVDHTGTAITQDDLKGRTSLVFFGFTYCPDVCPMTLVTIDRALEQLPDSVEAPQTVLISVDPERDTPEALATYISTDAFPDDIIGLTGTPEQIRAAADVFFADYARIESPESVAEYTMDHTSLVYLMDENWSLKTFFTHENSAETMSACLSELL